MASAPPPPANAPASPEAGADTALPIHVLTGFLGSGKTTLLNRALKTARFGDAAVMINELGVVAIDHLLVRETREELVLLASGCVCCTLRNDLIEALDSLLSQRARGEVPRFSRVLLETTGLADPAAIIQTLVAHAALRDRVYLDGILCTVDAQLGASTLRAQAIARRQVAVADRLLLTKRDLVDPAAIPALEEQLASLNPRAERVWVTPDADAGALLSGAGHLDTREIVWAANRPRAALYAAGAEPSAAAGSHLEDVGQVAVTLPQPVDFRRFSLWVSLITQMWAERLLRLKAVVSARGEPGPIAVQAVQHVVYPPLDLPPMAQLAGQSHVLLLIEKLSERERNEITESLLALAT